jgi:uncharacterized protein (UPF0548 family)
MFLLKKLTDNDAKKLVLSQEHQNVSYRYEGGTRNDQSPLPAGFFHDHYRCSLGHGDSVYQRGTIALRDWRMYPRGWTFVSGPWPDLCTGAHFVTQVRHFGFWSANCCRVMYLTDEEDKASRRFGFAIGTLPEHAECGEERFLVEQNKVSQEVFFDIRVFSRPSHWMAWLGFPLARILQRRFGREAQTAMIAASQNQPKG